MFGWEFPPHISGGLGTACYGITQGLSHLKNVEVTFVVPSTEQANSANFPRIISADQINMREYLASLEKVERGNLKMLKVPSYLKPYTNLVEYESITKLQEDDNVKPIKITNDGFVEFSGDYHHNLAEEVKYFAAVAEAIVQKENFDIIHAHDWPTFLAGKVAKEITGNPLVVHVHSTDFDRNAGTVNPPVFEMEKMGMEAADRIIAVSDYTKDIITSHYQQPTEKVSTIYNAIETADSRNEVYTEKNFQDADPENALQSFETESLSATTPEKQVVESFHFKDKIVTFLGRITAQKGPEFFVEAAEIILSKMQNVRFVMAGDGDQMHRMMELVAQKSLSDRFHFTGFLRGREVGQLLQMSNVYLMPSVSEPFGISTLEAIQAGVPVIVSKQSGVSEVIKHALKVDFWNVDALADSIYAVLSYPTLAETLKQNSLTEIKSLSWDDTALQLNAIYQRLISKTNIKTTI